MFGVDEAGRGPVLGSLFVACVHVPTIEVLPETVADSKQLAPDEIEPLSRELYDAEQITVTVIEVPVAEIEAADSVAKTTLRAFAEVIRRTDETTTGHVDTVYASPAQTERELRTHLPETVSVTAAVDADGTFPAVSAASIAAKHARERHMDALNTMYDDYAPIGSGYPSDEQTIAFLESYVADHGVLPPFTRPSWATAQDILQTAQQTDLSDWD